MKEGRVRSWRKDHGLLSRTNKSKPLRVSFKEANTLAWHGEWSFQNRWNSQKRRSRYGFKTVAQNGSASWPPKWSTLLLLKGISTLPTRSTTGLNITSTTLWHTAVIFSHRLSRFIIRLCTRHHRTSLLEGILLQTSIRPHFRQRTGFVKKWIRSCCVHYVFNPHLLWRQWFVPSCLQVFKSSSKYLDIKN